MLQISIQTQPNDETCGPTSLHGVYQYYGDDSDLATVIQRVRYLENGGTLAAWLGVDALEQGDYQVDLYTYNLVTFDPSWFFPTTLERHALIERLQTQRLHKTDPRLHESTDAYLRFLQLGGNIHFKTLTAQLLKSIFAQKYPVITGLSATFLYQSQREVVMPNHTLMYDDVKGEPCGHFVVLCGYDDLGRHVIVADPYVKNPISGNNYYKVKISRLINAILLGVITFDANLLVIKPKEKSND